MGSKHGEAGRLARLSGLDRSAWKAPMAGPMGTGAATDLAMVRAWLAGWDAEDLRLRTLGPLVAGGMHGPDDDLAFAEAMTLLAQRDGDDTGETLDVDGADMARLLALAGCADPDGAAVPGTGWKVEPDALRRWADQARRRIGMGIRPDAD